MDHRYSFGGDVIGRRPMVLVGAGLGLLLTLAGCTDSPKSPAPVATQTAPVAAPSLLDQARQTLASGDSVAAGQHIQAHLLQQPEDPVGLELAARVAVARGNLAEAIELLDAAIRHHAAPSVALYDALGRLHMQIGQPYEAAEVLRRTIASHPNDPKIRADYAGLVAALGMVRDAAEHLRWLLRRGHGGLSELIMLANLNVPQTDEAICNYALQKNPSDLRPKYSLTVADMYNDNWDRVMQSLTPVIEQHPQFAVAWAHYGRALVETASDDDASRQRLHRWIDNRPPGTDTWTAYWVAAGLWAERRGQPDQAAAAFRQAIEIDDCHAEALTHLAANLGQLGRDQQAQRVAARAAAVGEMLESVESFFSWRKNSQTAAIAVAGAMDRLGRPWEAEGWARAALSMTQQPDPQARQIHRQLHGKLTSTTPWQIPVLSVRDAVPLRDMVAFRWPDRGEQPAAADVPQGGPPAPSSIDAVIQFRDEAAQRGLDHRCAISIGDRESSLAIHQSNAGGAAVIDYDLDGWPDLYLSVVDGTPLQRDSSPNRLHRSLEGRFSDVTPAAQCGDRGYTQGVTAGDYNADGFPDLLVGNIGDNRLYRNNGDGTFSDVSEQVGLAGQRWTSSVAIADIDSDSHADIIEVNYCAGTAAFTQTCIDEAVGQPRSCGPLVFQAEPDRVYAGRGDGTFRDVTDQWLSDTTTGHGLGLMVAAMDDRPGIDWYVGNDMTANHFWSAQPSPDSFRFDEQAAVRGLAVDSRSRSQASMGIALGDADMDGDFDLFLTHFTDDYNTYYEQLRPGTWMDRTTSVGLAKESLDMLAFGTQWIDADNNGSLELMVANGNVDDFQHQGHPLRMRPQLFVRDADGRWQARDGQQLGEYFERSVVGRSLVHLDLNRDGRQDLVVTHLFDPVAALINHSQADSGAIRLRLVGCRSHRDGVGAIVRVQVGGATRVTALTAGDGFQCSNERVLTVGLGDAPQCDAVQIEWPSGATSQLGTLQAGQEYLVVEDAGEAFPMAAMR